MKTIKISNGEVRIGHEFKDLSPEIQEKVLCNWIEDEIQYMDEDSEWYDLAVKMDNNGTPWFLAQEIYHRHKNDVIETIEINDYLFEEDGEFMPVMHHYNKNQFVKNTYGKKELDCIIEDYTPMAIK